MIIELKDGTDWDDFLAELKPKSWYKRKEGEGNVDWLKRVAIKDSNWLEEAKERQRNSYWRQESLHFCFSVLTFLRQNNLSVEQMEEDLNMELDLSGSYDWRMSETEKIKHYMILYNGN
jgi:hypothetical protein